MNTLLLATACIGGSVLFSIIGVRLGRRLMHAYGGEGHNHVLIPFFMTAGVLYAVFLGIMMMATWKSYDAARNDTLKEAALLVPLYRQSKLMTPDKGDAMRKGMREYTEDVILGWRHCATGGPNHAAGRKLQTILTVFGTLSIDSKLNEIVATQFIATLSQAILARNKRHAAAAERGSWTLWAVAVGGGILTLGVSFFITMKTAWLQMLSTGILAVLIGTLLLMLALLGRPFIGPFAIDPSAFEASMSAFNNIDSGF